MSDENPKATPTRGVSQISDDSGIFSLPNTPGTIMLHVSVIFKGVCSKKIQQNFGYTKLHINPDLVLEEIQAIAEGIFSDSKLAELSDTREKHRKTDRLLKHILRKGEGVCKCFLKCLQSESIQAAFILEDLRAFKDKFVPPLTTHNIDIKDIHEHFEDIVKELENTDIIDPLLEYYVLDLDEHDTVVYTDKPNRERNSDLVNILCKKESADWIPGFILVLKDKKYVLLLSLIEHKGKRAPQVFPDQVLYDTTYKMSIKFQGINASKIEVKLARLADIDNLCRQFAKLSVSNIKQGSVLLLVHPISPDIWRKSSEEEKQKLLEEFIYQLIYQSDVKNLIQKEIDVSIEVNEIKNVFGDPAWRVKKSSQLTKEQQKLEDNWTYLVEEMEVKKIIEYFIERDVMTVMERQKIMDLPGRREQAKIFLTILKHKLGEVSIEDLIDGLVTTGQTYIGDRLKKEILCIDCLRETYKDPQNYEMILDEMVSSTMLQTVAKFEDKMIPHHILNILTPECGKSRRDRAHLFMQYVLLNDEVLRSFENVLATTNHVVFKVKKKCDDCKPRSSKDASYFETSLVEEKDRVFCSFTVRMETDKSLRIISLKRKKEVIEKKYVKTDRPLYSRLPSEPYMRELKDPTPIIAAIDFGTTYSGFAFSQKKKHAKIITKQWHNSSGSALQSFKTPTSILLQPEGNFHSFGYEAEEKYDLLSNGGDHRSWYFCRHFKMELHSSEILKRDTMIEDVLGKKKTAFDIFSMSIKYLKQEAEKLMLEKGQRVVKENISWIITVPAIWTDAAKQFMRQAAEEASIPSDRLTLALEPEVASIYIGALNVEKSRDASSSDVTLVKSAPGARFMVVDIGGGTVDITVMETATEQQFKQISLASGGPCGGKYVNDNILKYLASLVGEDVMETYRVKNMNDYHVLSNEIEFKKRSWKRGSKLQLELPVSFADHFEDTTNLTFSDHLKTASQKKVNLRGKHKLKISEDIAEQFTLSVVSDIISHVRDTLGNVKDISYMVIVGGFADNSLLKQEFNSAFPKNNIIIPDEAGLAVLKGAVLFGRDPSCVITRKCDRTYGTLVYRTFLKDDLREKRVKEIDGDYCKDAFNKLVGIGESISINEKRSTEMQPIRDGMSKMSIKLYGSTEPNPRYVTDRSCTYLGKIVVDIPHQWRNRDENVIVSMTFGQTEVVVEGKSEHGEHVVTTKLDFLV